MLRRKVPRVLCKFAVAAVAALAVALGSAQRADAGIRLTLTEAGFGTQQFFSDTNSLVSSATIGDYSVILNTVLTNFPGSPGGATLTTTANLATVTGSGTAGNLTILAEVVTSPAGAGSPLAPFTGGPGGPPFLVTNDVTATSAGGAVTSGMVDLTTFVNGTGVPLDNVSLQAALEQKNSGLVTTGPANFTLTNQLFVHGLNLGVPAGGLGITGSSSVTSVPAPAGLVLALTGLPLLGIRALVRRRRREMAA